MKDLGQLLYNQRRYDFSRVEVLKLLFKCTGDDVLLVSKVRYNDITYEATLCVTFGQLNDLLTASGNQKMNTEVAALIGEALSMKDQLKLQTTFQINLMTVFDTPLQVQDCTYHTHLVKLPLEELATEPDVAYVFLVSRMTFLPALK